MRVARRQPPNSPAASRHTRLGAWIAVFLVSSFLLPVRLLWSRQQQQQPQQSKSSPPPQQTPPSRASQPQTQKQEPPQSASKISTEVKLVTVYATVRDKHGKIVATLNQPDFTIQEDSRPQTVKYFARESDLPLTLGLLVDTSMSQRRVLNQERSASYTFFDRALRPEKDKAFLIHFDREVELLQDLTSSRERLRSALELLDTPEFTQARGSGGGGSGGRSHGGGTLLYDSIYLASKELMKKQQGRKALIILTDGVDHGSKESLNTAITAPHSAPIRPSTRFCSPMTKPTATEIRVDTAEATADMEEAGRAAVADAAIRTVPTAKKSSPEFQRRPGASFLK